MTETAAKPAPFEQRLRELETLVQRYEQGQLPLDEALKQFEVGVKLVSSCQHTLKTAEQKVQQLIEEQGELQLTPFESDNSA